jgi:hypothetical protein
MSAEARINIVVEGEDVARSIERFQGAIDILGGSVETLVGGLALFGVENKYIENLEQGALGAIAFADGTKRLADGLKDFVGETKLATAAQAAFNFVQNLNPIFLIVTALAAATTAVIIFTNAMADSAKETALANSTATDLTNSLDSGAASAAQLGLSMEDVADIAAQSRGEAEAQLEVLDSQEETLKRQGLSEKEIEDLKIAQLETIVKSSQIEANARRDAIKGDVERTTRYANITKAILTFLTSPISLILKSIDLLTAGLAKVGVLAKDQVTNLQEDFVGGVAKLLFDPEEVAAEGEAAAKEAEKQAADAQNAIDGIINKRNERRKAAASKAAEEAKKEAEKAAAEVAKAAEAARQRLDEITKGQLDDLARRRVEAEEQYNKDLETFKDNEAAKVEAKKLYDKQIADIDAEELKRKADAAAAKKAIDDKAAAEEKKAADEAAKTVQERNDAIAAAEADLAAAKLEFAYGTLAALSTIAGENEQLQNAIFAVEKAVAIGEIITNLQKEIAANNFYGSSFGPAGVAYSGPKNIAAKLRAATSIATIVAATISKFKGGGGAGLGGGASETTPGFILGSSIPSQNQQPVTAPNVQAGGPIQAYVLAGDVSSGLEAEQKFNSRRKL